MLHPHFSKLANTDKSKNCLVFPYQNTTGYHKTTFESIFFLKETEIARKARHFQPFSKISTYLFRLQFYSASKDDAVGRGREKG